MTDTKTNLSRTIGRGVVCIIAGVAATVALSYGMDYVLIAAGFLKTGPLPMYGSEALIVGILFYRTIFNALGCYIAAKLAPNYPTRYAWGLGIFGFLGSIGGAFASGDLGPAWYAWSLAVLALPAAWLGVWLYKMQAKTA